MSNLGQSLFNQRKKQGLSQEQVAQKLGVSRQTISKWETDETLPDVYQAKRLAKIYQTSLDELLTFDTNLSQIKEAIAKAPEKVDWTKLWGQKYPILLKYTKEVTTKDYVLGLRGLLTQ